VIYLVMAYRWGNANGHRYTVGAFLDLREARAAAAREHERRAGKYAIEVQKWFNGFEIEPDEPVIYLPTSTEAADAERPRVSSRIELCAHVGATVLTRWDAETSLEDHRGDWPAWLVAHLPAPSPNTETGGGGA
jgi:hypothetical protein